MWPKVQKTPEGHDACEDLFPLRPSESCQYIITNTAPLSMQRSFRRWVGMHDLVFSMAVSGQISRLRHQGTAGSLTSRERTKLHLMKVYASSTRPYIFDALALFYDGNALSWCTCLPSEPLSTLGPNHSSETLAWATEYLSINIAGCRMMVHNLHYPELMLHRSHWAEADGGVNTLDHKINERALATRGILTCSWIPDPLTPGSYIDGHAARAWILMSPFAHAVTGSNRQDSTEVDKLSPTAMQDLTYFFMARQKPQNLQKFTCVTSYQDDSFNPWASALFKRYILAAMPTSAKPIDNTSLEQHRRSFDMLLSLIHVSHAGISMTPPAHYIDSRGQDCDGLYLPFLWRLHRVLSSSLAQRL